MYYKMMDYAKLFLVNEANIIFTRKISVYKNNKDFKQSSNFLFV